MPEKFECPNCGNSLIVLKLDTGKEAECVRCRLWSTIPDSTATTFEPLNCRVRMKSSEPGTPHHPSIEPEPQTDTSIDGEKDRVGEEIDPGSRAVAAARVAAFRDALIKSAPSAIVTRIIIGCNALLFIIMMIAGASFLDVRIADLVRFGARYNIAIFQSNQWWRLFTASFLSAGIGHFAIGMWFFWIFGNLAERVFGNGSFLAITLASGLIGTIAGFIASPGIISATSSACVLGAAGSLIAFIVTGRVIVPRLLVNKIIQDLVILGAILIVAGFLIRGVDNAANLGGLVTGFVGGLVFTRLINTPNDRGRTATTFALFIAGVLAVALTGAFIGKAFVENNPDNEIAHVEELLSRGKEAEAFDILDRNRELFSKLNNGEYFRAIFHIRKGEFKEGIDILNTLVSTDPDNPGLLETLAQAYLKSGAYTESADTFRYLIRILPDNAIIYGNLAWVYYSMNDPHTCITLSKKALELDETLVYVRYNIAIAMLRLGDIEGAIAKYTEIKPSKEDIENGSVAGAIGDLEDLVHKGIMREEARSILRSVFGVSDETEPEEDVHRVSA
jgi:membrane associated rhomboid family serine protease